MSDTTTPTGADGLAGLVAKWREAAGEAEVRALDLDSQGDPRSDWFEAKSQFIEECADELEAALSSVADGEAWAALRRFVKDAQQVDVGGGDAVVTTCESLEMAQAALATRPAAPVGGDGEVVTCEFCGGRGFTDDGHVEWDGQVVSAPEGCVECDGRGTVPATRPAAAGVGEGFQRAWEHIAANSYDHHTPYMVCIPTDEWRKAEALAAAPSPAAGVGEDWKLVPVNPTPEMLCAAGVMNNYDVDAGGRADDDHIAWWKDMLAAAPSPGAGGEVATPLTLDVDKNAARYRFIRKHASAGAIVCGSLPGGALNCDEPEPEWDAAIDAAMAATHQEQRRHG